MRNTKTIPTCKEETRHDKRRRFGPAMKRHTQQVCNVSCLIAVMFKGSCIHDMKHSTLLTRGPLTIISLICSSYNLSHSYQRRMSSSQSSFSGPISLCRIQTETALRFETAYTQKRRFPRKSLAVKQKKNATTKDNAKH